MELKLEHLNQITCEFILFNRQHIKFSNRVIKRKIVDHTGKEIILYTKKLSFNELILFFNEIKSIYLDGKIVACRGCSELPLVISNHEFSKMKARQKLLRESKIRYREWQKEEWKSWRNEMFQYSKKYKRVSA